MKKRDVAAIITAVIVGLMTACIAVYFLDPTGHWRTISRHWRNNRPINFYGKVVDQQGNPLRGAKVTICISYFDIRNAMKTSGDHFSRREITRITDSEGRFSVTGESGHGLGIVDIDVSEFVSIPERGWTYESYRRLLSFNFAVYGGANPTYAPDPDKPALFPLRRPNEPRTMPPVKGGSESIKWKKAK